MADNGLHSDYVQEIVFKQCHIKKEFHWQILAYSDKFWQIVANSVKLIQIYIVLINTSPNVIVKSKVKQLKLIFKDISSFVLDKTICDHKPKTCHKD